MLAFDVNKSTDLVQLSEDGLVERHQSAMFNPLRPPTKHSKQI